MKHTDCVTCIGMDIEVHGIYSCHWPVNAHCSVLLLTKQAVATVVKICIQDAPSENLPC
jgi:hypothetical protein